jgi:CubicO group peptidase (beta-lactamase class C family)
MTSLMIGKLISEGKLKESDTFVSILPEFKSGTDFDQVKISDLLDMSGGVAVSDNYPSGPSGWGVAIAQMYATTDLNFFLKHNRRMDAAPGSKAEYRSVDTQMLGMVIKKITGERLADYFSNSFWKPVGAEYAATWNVDRVGGQEKTFCCFNATARDYARIGQLILNNGASTIGGANLIDANWMKRLTTSKVTLDRNWGYGAQIWHPYSDSTMMLGLHGQYVFIQPSTHTVIVKLSDEPTNNGNNESLTAAVLHDLARVARSK